MTTPLPAAINAPYSQEAEEAVLGAVLVNPSAFISVASFLKAEDFFLLRHSRIWQAFLRLSERNEPIDFLTITTELKNMGVFDEVGGHAYLMQLINNTPTSVHAEIYGRLVERTAIRRRMLEAADKIRELALDEDKNIEAVLNEAESSVFSIGQNQIRREFVPMWEALSAYYDRMEFMLQHQRESLGVPSGFRDLDQLLGGFQKSDLIVFAGRPGMGKCVAAGSIIDTIKGFIPIEALQPANTIGTPDDEGGIYYPLEIEVQTPFGTKCTSHFYDGGIKPTLKITTRLGYSLSATHAHPVMVLNRQGEKVWKPMAELQCGDYVAVVPEYISTSGYISYPEYFGDEIVAIEDDGLQHVYDLVVPDGHAFVANGIVSHNTSFLLTTAINAARVGARVGIFTMEMGTEQIVQRMVSMESGINMQKLRLAQLTPQEQARFVEVVGRISDFPIFIDDTPAMSPLEMRTKCRRLVYEHGLDMIMIDYMQLMNAGGGKGFENNRVQEISYISRNLKELARELNIPVISAAQLSRAVEQRNDKRPVLSDLRESGCLAGETLVYLPDCGQYVPIRDLVGKKGFCVTSLNTETWKLEPGEVTNAFCTGIKPVYKLTTALGRSIRATANHKFLTIQGWKRLDELTTADHIALPRYLESPQHQTMSDAELALLGHLIGDGCTLPTHAVQYTTVEVDLAQTVADLAVQVFGDRIKPRIHKEPGRNWYQVFLAPTMQLTHGVRNPVGVWLEKLGLWGKRSYEKFVPAPVFEQSEQAIALFLRHLWATDGCILQKKTARGYYPAVYYASSSQNLAADVQSLLLRVGINARLKRVSQKDKGRDQFHVIVTGISDLKRFVQMGAVGQYKQGGLKLVEDYVQTYTENTNRDIIPHHIWRMYSVPAMKKIGMSTRKMQELLGNQYCGTGLYKQNVSRERAARLSTVVKSEEVSELACSDVYWAQVQSIEPDGETEVYDLTVPGNSCFIANSVVSHNSIEQDADVVIFLYRDEVYNEATEVPNQADIIVSKHRNGPTGVISLYFEKQLTKFMDASVHRVDLSSLE